MLLSLKDVITALQGLPTGLLAALGFVFVVFFLAILKMQLDALTKYVEKTQKSLHGIYEAIARMERAMGGEIKTDSNTDKNKDNAEE